MRDPKPFGLNQLRQLFLSFFEEKGHLALPSFSLIPQNDPSLLLINSGMAPMKPWFTGEEQPPSNRICSCQKCIRTGDIENIGKTARHGTYFEMLGNFSFGDYFKREAIAWSWEFLTSPQWVGLDPQRLYPSVYTEDQEAFDLWHQEMHIPKERIFRFGKKDNFWEHGSGPCGPCSEIYYDRGEAFGCGSPQCTVGCDCDRYIEVWNNVFSQFDNDGQGNYTELAQKNIDTGMGLERLACICQQVPSLFEVDTVMRITQHVTQLTGVSYGESQSKDVSLRVITDHIRSSTMMICDGVLPSNEGRGYVLRRLLRRAARHGKLLGMHHPFLFQICQTVIEENQGYYPQLNQRQDYIVKVIRVEEENFLKTIDSGLKIFEEMLSLHREQDRTIFSGADAFRLYDTYGFPIDLTLEMAADQGMKVDLEDFTYRMEEQKLRARKAREAMGDLGWSGLEFGKEVPPTRFVGYDQFSVTGTLLAIVVEEELREEIGPGAQAILVLDQTPFYSELGGQVGDRGEIFGPDVRFLVRDVQKNKGGKFMHYGTLHTGILRVGDQLTASIDLSHRQAVARAHTATHLLHKALQTILGEHVHQAGSLVEADMLRFDFTHFSSLTSQELDDVSHQVNQAILQGYPVETREMPLEEAKAMGAVALFGEKYGDEVRVVDMGGYSVELCGGTHLAHTSQVGLFHITSEFSVASGVRRIEAMTGERSIHLMNQNQELLFQVSAILKTRPSELHEKAEQFVMELRSAHQLLQKFQEKESAGQADQMLSEARPLDDLRILTATLPPLEGGKLRQMGDLLRDKAPGLVAVLACVVQGKITFLAVCGKEAVARGVKAGDLIKLVTGICGGKGGGKADSAMGGGSDLQKLDDALAEVDNFVRKILGTPA